MPAPHLKYHTSRIVVWPPGTTYDDYGRLRRSTPCERTCRWEESNEEVTDDRGEVIRLSARITVSVVLDLGSIVYRGCLEDFNEAEQAGEKLDLLEAKTVERIPDVKGRGVSRVIGLARHRNTLPTLET